MPKFLLMIKQKPSTGNLCSQNCVLGNCNYLYIQKALMIECWDANDNFAVQCTLLIEGKSLRILWDYFFKSMVSTLDRFYDRCTLLRYSSGLPVLGIEILVWEFSHQPSIVSIFVKASVFRNALPHRLKWNHETVSKYETISGEKRLKVWFEQLKCTSRSD